MAKVLLTGARGFIGGAALRRLRADGHEVVALSSAGGNGDGEWRRLDLLQAGEDEIARLVRADRITHCLHAAWYTNHSDYLVADVNRDWVQASLRLEAGFRAGGGRRFVGLGTCLEYDQDASGGRFSESSTPIRPETLYARCKTSLFEELSERGGDFAWARVFFVYGPGDRSGRLIPLIVEGLAKGERVAARFGGLRRDYVHVDDLAGQLSRMLFAPVQGAVNTGTGAAARVADIFILAGEIAGRPDLIEVNDLVGPGEAEAIEADMERFSAEIGDPGARPLRQGLAELMA
ncbi:MAG TPA: NAD(P)-dependent oxidoreductase [Allosphingosinicella sp.]|nr:NAD(P)-dependent oxidoreductase [Allosphingosinicella sp.]